MRKQNKVAAMVACVIACSALIVEARHPKTETTPLPSGQQIITEKKCLQCQGPMEQGFLLEDRGQYPNTDSCWVQGAVYRKRKFGSVQTDVSRHIVALRCTNCGLLQLYANELANN